ncbi:olfactory receptor 1361-like [Antechinus flavipes]|uniref:olfactory receptor 1361-like n=1 Tax=Antechinus flavipes TaxID=38775 RepID=UPI002235D3A9|nr:olfactory receptor 1361-like [Antechinus flavipes]
MDRENQTVISEFLLLGLSSQPEQQKILFWLFLCVYLVTVFGNLLIMLAIGLDARLHSPMYFFLANLSFVDICFSSVTIPKMLINHISKSNSISYVECMIQMYFFITFINMDGFLLVVMAYDRYMAICRPLHYATVMRPGLCILLVAISWVITNLHALLHTLLMAQLMNRGNLTSVSEFLLLGLSRWPEHQQLLFPLFLGMYLITVIGNLLIILAICSNVNLHSPMYFFLINLSFTDICFISTTVPKMLMNLYSQDYTISYVKCLTQMYFFTLFVGLDDFLLGMMAYDRYIAICRPLHYSMVMSPRICILFVSGSWIITNSCSLLHTLLVNQLSFCEENIIPHFFCDLSAMLKLSCSDTYVNDLEIIIVGGFLVGAPFILIIVSYIHIILAILKIPSTGGKYKAFSTCGSHLCSVSIFYGTLMGVYFLPSSTHLDNLDMLAAIFYTILTPMLNPFIYSLRNQDMQNSLRLFLNKRTFFFR